MSHENLFREPASAPGSGVVPPPRHHTDAGYEFDVDVRVSHRRTRR